MSRTLDTLLRPSLLAVAIALSAPLASTTLYAAEQASSVRAYNLPAAPLATTLNQIASQAGLALTLNPGTRRRQDLGAGQRPVRCAGRVA